MKCFANEVVMFFFACVLLIGCGKVEQSKILKVGYTQEAPYSYISPQGKAAGLFPDMVKSVTNELGYEKVEWVLLSFDSLMPALAESRIDLIAAGMAVNQQRSKSICFAQPLVSASSAVIYDSNNERIEAKQSILKQDIIFSAIYGSVEAKFLKEEVHPHSIIEVEDPFLGLLAIKKGHADALLMTEPTLTQLRDKNKGLSAQPVETAKLTNMQDMRVVQLNKIGVHQAAFAFRREDSALVARWNKVQRRHSGEKDFRRKASKLGFSSPLSLASIDSESCYAG